MADISIEMETDDYGLALNRPGTYGAIAHKLLHGRSALIGWTDEAGSHMDVLFTLSPTQFGPINSGLHGQGILFVSVLRCGAFGFDILNDNFLAGSYVSEKLNLGYNVTADKLAILITGIRKTFIELVESSIRKEVTNGTDQ